ncbi:hypothetical protein SDC9_165563 [bioreactor metagenome]|uniref:Uncharacterized protein n=1 Tax=bioreactor metagenome TaxID=1076179 RepID=A0A645G237_9ZZZZ
MVKGPLSPPGTRVIFDLYAPERSVIKGSVPATTTLRTFVKTKPSVLVTEYDTSYIPGSEVFTFDTTLTSEVTSSPLKKEEYPGST